MKIKLTCGRAGHNFVQNAGDIVDVDPAEAGRVYSGGMGVFVNDEDKAVALAASGTADPSFAPVGLPASTAVPVAAGTLAGDDDDDDDALPEDPSAAPTTALGKAKAKAKAKAKDSE